MTTASDLVEEAKRYLNSTTRDVTNKLVNAVTDTTSQTLTMTYDLNTLVAGARVSVGLEDMLVWDANKTAKTATVERGIDGSDAATHSAGDLLYVNAKFTPFRVFQALNAEIDALTAEGLYSTDEITLTYNPAVTSYDLTSVTDITDILYIEYDIPGSSKLWPRIKSYRWRRSQNTTDFPSGFALTLYDGGYPGRDIRVVYSKALVHLTDLTTDVSATGLPATAYDLVPLGAALRLSGIRELARNAYDGGQGDTRRPSEVGTGAQLQSMIPYAQQYARRLRQELQNLSHDYPVKKRLPV